MSTVDFFDFNRATQGTFIGKNGLIQTANANVPRFQFDANGNGQGAIIEPARTNLLKYSEDYTQSVWFKFNISVSANQTTAPDGTLTADKYIVLSDGAINGYQEVIATSTANTFSIYTKAGTTPTARFIIRNDSTGINIVAWIFDYANPNVGIPSGCYYETLNNGWYRLILKVTSGITVGDILRIYSGAAGASTVGKTWYVWGAQLEQGTVPTSYIKTTSAAVTRIADEVRTEGKIYQIGQSEGAIFAKVNTSNVASSRVICDLYSTPNTGIKFGKTNTDAYYVAARVGGTETANVVSSNVNYQGINKVAARYNATGLALYVNGIQEGSASVNVANVLPNSIAFGHDADAQNQFIEPISGFALFKRALGNNELKGLTE